MTKKTIADLKTSIHAYNRARSSVDKAICEMLMKAIDQNLPEAKSKMWHAHPVWFLDDNPIVGYGKLKDCVRLMFWSGQTFEETGLKPVGKFKAAEVRYTAIEQVDKKALKKWCEASQRIQWDYKNIVKRRGRLERLV